jgi:acyl carrier protein
MENVMRESAIKILAEYLKLPPEKIRDDSKLIEELGVDSLATLELVMKFEEEFNIEIENEDTYKMRTVSDIINYLKKQKREPL